MKKKPHQLEESAVWANLGKTRPTKEEGVQDEVRPGIVGRGRPGRRPRS